MWVKMEWVAGFEFRLDVGIGYGYSDPVGYIGSILGRHRPYPKLGGGEPYARTEVKGGPKTASPCYNHAISFWPAWLQRALDLLPLASLKCSAGQVYGWPHKSPALPFQEGLCEVG